RKLARGRAIEYEVLRVELDQGAAEEVSVAETCDKAALRLWLFYSRSENNACETRGIDFGERIRSGESPAQLMPLSGTFEPAAEMVAILKDKFIGGLRRGP